MSTDRTKVERAHYAYCEKWECSGCLPTDEELEVFGVLALWGEMLARCIAQTPQTKTREGALAAIRDARYAGGIDYRTLAADCRIERFGPP